VQVVYEVIPAMKRNFFTYGIIFLSLFCFLDLSVGWSCFIFIALAVLLFFQQRGEGTPLPPVSFVLLGNVLGYPIVVLMPWMYRALWTRMNPYIIELAMLWAVRGFAAFCCAYLLVDALVKHFHRQKYHGQDDAERLAYMRYVIHTMGILSIIAWLIKASYFGFGLAFISSQSAIDISSAQGSVTQVLQLLIGLRNLFFFLFGVMYVRRQHDRFMWLLFAGTTLGLLFEILTVGSKGVIILPLVIAALVIACTARRISAKQFCVGALMLFTVYMAFMVITEYRAIMYDRNRSGEDVFDTSVQVEAFTEAFLASLPFTETIEQRRTTVTRKDIFSRITSGVFSFGMLLYFTGGRSPHEHALEMFLLPVYSIAPRSLIEKPVFFNAGRFGQEYFHTNTAISVSTLGGFYYPWGYSGILAGMAVLGASMAYAIRRTLIGNINLNSMVFMVTMVLGFVNVSTDFAGVTTNLCRLAVILLGLYMVYPAVKRMKSGRPPIVLSASSRIGGDL
jgi:hypothetical protein